MSCASSEHRIDTLSVRNWFLCISVSQLSAQQQNYDMHEELAQGAASTVYRATCKRGRLRNRLVAVKKVRLRVSRTLLAHQRMTDRLHRNTSTHPLPRTGSLRRRSMRLYATHPSYLSYLSSPQFPAFIKSWITVSTEASQTFFPPEILASSPKTSSAESRGPSSTAWST